MVRHTGVFQDKLDIEDGDDLALSLADIDVAFHGLDLADSSLDIAILGL